MRSKIYILFFLLCIAFNSSAQFTLRIELTAAPSAHSDEAIYVAGNFNEWKPGDNKFLFSKENGKTFLEIKGLTAAAYQFKFTRGNWEKVEATEKGIGIGNRVIELSSDTTVSCSIGGWADDFAVPQKNTASSNVHVMDTAFFIPQLNRTRRIWIYLPQGYASTKKHYPVMYLQDGQNLFDERTSAFGNEWGVDECLDSLIAKGKPGCIVVGIDNGGDKRMSEYNPYEFTLTGANYASQKFSPQGDEYLGFLAKTLKPFIDKHYRTLSSKENTIIAGSSMGGLIAYYAAIKYPDTYGKAGVFSPAFWTAPQVKELTDSLDKKIDGKFFFYIGEQEGETHINNMNEMAEKLGANSNAMIYSVIDPEGKHNETAWRKWFAEFYKWMMADGYNNVIKLE
jgi:predicted alpha/beta superfamily hydrolase